MNRSESKFQNTAIKMCDALIALLEKKEFSDITIMDICNKAGVYRSTFYSHYDNTYDLLKETHGRLVSNFMLECAFDTSINISDLKNLDKDDLNFITPKYLLPYLNYIKRNKLLFKIYAKNIRFFEANDLDQYISENLFIPILEKHGITDKRLVFYMQKYYLKGIDAIINEWVCNDCDDDILFVCEIITFCIKPLSYKK